MIALVISVALASPWGTAKRACRADDTAACASAALELAESLDPRGLVLLREACASGGLAACEPIAKWSLQGRGPLPLEPADARDALQHMCDGGRATSCTDLGWVLEHGQAGEPDLDAARAAYARACDSGAADGCLALRTLGGEVTGDARVSACSSGDDASCISLSAEWMDTARAVELEEPLRMSCGSGSAIACGTLGTLLVSGRGIPQDGTVGLALLERACTLGAAPSCVVAADLWLTGMVGERDEERAHQLLHRGCELGDRSACSRDHDHD
jgi:hypothetical protein